MDFFPFVFSLASESKLKIPCFLFLIFGFVHITVKWRYVIPLADYSPLWAQRAEMIFKLLFAFALKLKTHEEESAGDNFVID